MNKRVIAALGMPGAGKSEFVGHLTAKGVPSVYFGGITLKEIEHRGLELNPENEQFVRKDIRAKEGPGAYAGRIVSEINELFADNHDVVISDGLYSWDEYKIFNKNFGDNALYIAVAATRQLRYERLSTRPVRPLTPQQAHARDFDQLESMNSNNPIAIADYTIVNNGDLESFQAAIDSTLAEAGISF